MIDNMTRGISFENHCCKLLQRLGFDNCELTPTNNDQGADILGNYSATRYVFQCKDHKKPVGNRAIQEAVSAKPVYRAARCGVISKNGFTNRAYKLARANNSMLFTACELEEAVNSEKSFNDLIQSYEFNASTPVEHNYDLVKVYEERKRELGHTPQRKDFDPSTLYRIKKHYGNLTNLIHNVGDTPYSSRPSDEEIIKEYQRIKEKVGRTPTLEDMERLSSFSRNCFSAFPFTQLQKQCGDRPNIERGVSEQQLIDAFEELARNLGRAPKVKDLDEKGRYRASYYRTRWGSMDSFRKEMGIAKGSLGQRRYEKQELVVLFLLLKKIFEIREDNVSFRLTHSILEETKFRENVLVSPSTFSRKFGGWETFLCQMSDGAYSGFSSDFYRLLDEFLGTKYV